VFGSPAAEFLHMLHKNIGVAALVLALSAACSSSNGTGVVPVTGGPPPASGGSSSTGGGGATSTGGGASAGTGGAPSAGSGGASNAGTGGSGGDPNACTPACSADKACVLGTCMTAPVSLTTSAGCGSMRLAVKGDTLYFTDSMHGSVRKVPVAGGTASDIVTGQMKPYALAVDATNVYFGNQGDFTLKFAPLAGSATKTITTGATAGTLGLALGTNVLFYGDGHNLNSVALAENSTPTVLGQGDTGGKGLPTMFALDATNVYYTDSNAFGIERHPQVGTGDSVAMVGSQGDLVMDAIAVQGGMVYFATGSNLAAMAVTADKTSGSFSTITSSVQGMNFTGFAADNMNLYLGEDGFVETSALAAGSDAKVIAVGQPKPQAFVVDANNVYYVTIDAQSSCSIMKLALK
jgi:hypothetical protein